MRLPRILSAVALSAAMATPLVSTSHLFAQAKPADPATPAADPAKPAAAPAPANPDAAPPLAVPAAANPLTAGAENFWHYAKIAKYDLAAAEGQKLLDSGAPAADLLAAFEAVAADRRDNLFETLFKWMNVDPMRDVSQKLVAKLKEGQNGKLMDPAWIAKEVEHLSVNERAFEIALQNLRSAGEYAAPIMVDVLRDPAKKNLHSQTRRALVRLGRQVLNPLVAVMESKDHATLITIGSVLGEIGYDVAAPYIARVYASKDPGMQEVQSALAIALGRLGVSAQTLKASDMFYDLSEKFYYKNASILPDPRFPEAAHIWYWDDAKGLTAKDVPPGIFSDIMSMRCAEYALKLDPSRADAVSLWLAANNKREADLPEGKTDATHEGPDAHYYNVAEGTQYCNAVLERALRDHSAPVALKVVKSLQEIIGQSNMFQGAAASGGKEPIVGAMSFANRPVRYEAAIAVGSALPQQAFAGQELVVPTLAEAISDNGKPNVLIVAGDANAANAIKESLKDTVKADTGTDATSASEAAGRLPSVDVLVIDSRSAKDIDEVIAGPRVKGVVKVILVENKSSPFVSAELDNTSINTLVAGTAAPEAAALTDAIGKARARAGSAPMDEKLAADYAQRAATLLERIAISRSPALDVSIASGALMRALDDPRVEIAKSSAGVLSMLNSKEVQAAIGAKALDEKTPDDLKIACFKALARSAKFWGNQLDAGATDSLQKVVETNANLQVKSAAAEAQGALNLPAERAKNLIINQSQVGK